MPLLSILRNATNPSRSTRSTLIRQAVKDKFVCFKVTEDANAADTETISEGSPPSMPGSTGDSRHEFVEGVVSPHAPVVDRFYHSPCRERLPRSLLPDNGFIAVREETGVAIAFDMLPSDPTGEGMDTIGLMVHCSKEQGSGIGSTNLSLGRHSKWREYVSVTFQRGYHYIEIRLALDEINAYANKNNVPARSVPRTGWVVWEDTTKPVPQGKLVLFPNFEVMQRAVVVFSLFGLSNNTIHDAFDDVDVGRCFSVVEHFGLASHPGNILSQSVSHSNITFLPAAYNLTDSMLYSNIFSSPKIQDLFPLLLFPDQLQVVVFATPICNMDLVQIPPILCRIATAFEARLRMGVNGMHLVHYFVSMLVSNPNHKYGRERLFQELFPETNHSLIRYDLGAETASHLCRPASYYTNRMSGKVLTTTRIELDALRCTHPQRHYSLLDEIIKPHVGSSLWRLENPGGVPLLCLDRDYVLAHGGNGNRTSLPMSVYENLLGIRVHSTTKIGEYSARLAHFRDHQHSLYHIKHLLLGLHPEMSCYGLHRNKARFVDKMPKELAEEKLSSTEFMFSFFRGHDYDFYEGILEMVDSIPHPSIPQDLRVHFPYYGPH